MVLDPVCGMRVDAGRPKGGSLQFEGISYHFCSDHCRRTFAEGPPDWLSAKDPVCGTALPRDSAHSSLWHDGKAWFFCSEACEERFRADPTAFGAPPFEPEDADGSAAAAGAGYTCPMHPEIVQPGPGDCPLCGMALERRSPGLDEANPALDAARRQLAIAAALTLPIFAWSMAGHLPGIHPGWMHAAWSGWLQLALALPVALGPGRPVFARAVESLRHRSPNMYTLIGMGTGAALGFSVVALALPGLFPADSGPEGGRPPLYFEAAAVILTLVLLGEFLELRARAGAGAALRALLKLQAHSARRIAESGEESDVALAEVRPGDRLRVRPGETVPVDGVVLEGESFIDESLLSGESAPRRRAPGDAVTGSTLNGGGSFVMRAGRVGADTLLARIVRQVAEAQRTRAPIQRTADRVAAVFVPAVVAVSLASFVAWFAWGPEPRLAHALLNAVSVLIIACPCALGLATPMSILVGAGRGAQAGVLFRDAAALEAFAGVDTLLFDKTGTLTEGRPKVVAVVPVEPAHESGLLSLAEAVERHSEHPLARAVLEAAAGAKARRLDSADFESRPGLGVAARVAPAPGAQSGPEVQAAAAGVRVALGSAEWMRLQGADPAPLEGRAEELRRQAATVFFICRDKSLSGLLAVADPVKSGAAAAIAALRAEGLTLRMVSGDARATAEAVAAALGLDEPVSGATPEGKAGLVRDLQAQGRRVAMAGDGVNDAPALAQADVGVAMGTGADAAMQAAAVTLLKGDLAGLLRARRLSLAVLRNIRQNLFWALAYNSVGVPLAAGLAYPFTGTLLPPVFAAAAMSFSSVAVIGNALRLKRVKL